MYTGNRFPLGQVLRWTRRETLFLTAVAILPPLFSLGLDWTWITVPWVPVALLGTASAFTVGFRNNATYARTWEARQIWGSIVNASRTWGLLARDLPRDVAGSEQEGAASATRALVLRHLAWLTALRYQLREQRSWEAMDRPENREYQAALYQVVEHDGALGEHLHRLLAKDEADAVLGKSNRATAILSLQSEHLKTLHEHEALDVHRYLSCTRQISELLEHQGRCERIKSFPYPRQFATLSHYFIRLFVWLVPFGMYQEFQRINASAAAWLSIPFSVVVTWIFLTLEKVGESSENPFQGGPNDIPITALSRTIEIDLREMIGDTDVPKPLAPVNSILM